MSEHESSVVELPLEFEAIQRSHYSLMTSYVRLLESAHELPFIHVGLHLNAKDLGISTYAGRATESFVQAHVRSRLATLSRAYIYRSAMQGTDAAAEAKRKWFKDTAKECSDLAVTLKSSRQVLSPVIGLAPSLIGIFASRKVGGFDLHSFNIVAIALAMLWPVVYLLTAVSASFRKKQRLFSQGSTDSAYRLEQEHFRRLGVVPLRDLPWSELSSNLSLVTLGVLFTALSVPHFSSASFIIGAGSLAIGLISTVSAFLTTRPDGVVVAGEAAEATASEA